MPLWGHRDRAAPQGSSQASPPHWGTRALHFYRWKLGSGLETLLDEWTCQNMETHGAGGTLDLQEQGWEFIQQLEFVVLSQEERESLKSQRWFGFLNWKSRNLQLESPEVPGRAGEASLQVESSCTHIAARDLGQCISRFLSKGLFFYYLLNLELWGEGGEKTC